MESGQMGTRTNGPRTNGFRTNVPRTNGHPDKWAPGQMGTGTKWAPNNYSPDKWHPGQIGCLQLAKQISSEQVWAKDVMKNTVIFRI